MKQAITHIHTHAYTYVQTCTQTHTDAHTHGHAHTHTALYNMYVERDNCLFSEMLSCIHVLWQK